MLQHNFIIFLLLILTESELKFKMLSISSLSLSHLPIHRHRCWTWMQDAFSRIDLEEWIGMQFILWMTLQCPVVNDMRFFIDWWLFTHSQLICCLIIWRNGHTNTIKNERRRVHRLHSTVLISLIDIFSSAVDITNSMCPKTKNLIFFSILFSPKIATHELICVGEYESFFFIKIHMKSTSGHFIDCMRISTIDDVLVGTLHFPHFLNEIDLMTGMTLKMCIVCFSIIFSHIFIHSVTNATAVSGSSWKFM